MPINAALSEVPVDRVGRLLEPTTVATPSTGRHAHADKRRPSSLREIILALGLLLCYGFFRQAPAWNEYSRYDLVLSLVNHGSTIIDAYEENTGDKAFYAGHYYSDKAPGTSLLGVPVYALLRLVHYLFGLGEPGSGPAIHALAFAVSGVPTVVLVLLLLRFLRPAVGEGWALVVSVGYGLGSLAFPFATMYFGHAASASFLFCSFYLLWRAKDTPSSRWRPTAAGLLAGAAVLVEYSALLGAAVLVVYAALSQPALPRRRPVLELRGALLMLAGAAVPAAALFAYNWMSFGGPLSLSYDHLAPGAFAEGMGRGILGVTWPRLDQLRELLFGPRGLLFLAPWFALAPAGLLALRQERLRAEIVLCTVIVVLFLAFNAGYYLPFGGWTPGPRFLLPALPFAAVLVAVAPSVLRPLITTLMTVSVAMFIVVTATMPNAPELYRKPLPDLWIPRALDGDLVETLAWLRWGLHGIQPLVVLAGGLALTAVGLLSAGRRGGTARRVTAATAIALGILVGAFSLPLLPDQPVFVGSAEGRSDSVTVVDAGSRRVPVEGEPAKAALTARDIWAQLENRGPAIDGTRVTFTLHAPDGTQAWSAWHDNVSWRSGERKRLSVRWSSDAPVDTDYRVGVTITSSNGSVVYGDVDDAETFDTGS